MVESFPLYWPDGWKRTPAAQRNFGRFRLGFAVARDGLMQELERMGVQGIVLSTNVALRRDGLPYATHGRPEDPGAAVYFTRKGKPLCFACDRFEMVKDNLNAIKHTVEALRGIERWGASDMLERAFTGFAALTSGPAPDDWREALGFAPGATPGFPAIASQFRVLAQRHHPDQGGDREQFEKLLAARDAAHEWLRS